VRASSARNETRRIGSYPWFSTTSSLYHTQVCHSELSGEYPGQLDPRPPAFGLLGFTGCLGLSGSFGPMNGSNETNQIDQTEE
jgi:hypothetical protein